MKKETKSLLELSLHVKEVLDKSFALPLWVVAEIAEMKVNASGHCYLELIEKDSLNGKTLARARATIWSYTFRMLKPYFETTTGQELSAGLRVLVSVTVEYHEVYGFSLNIRDIDPSYTMGDLARQRTETIRRLEEEGVLNMNRELPLAPIPQRIAIISSETAAGYEDFIDQLEGNEMGYAFAHYLFPAVMQGNEAAGSVIAALERIHDHLRLFDVVVIIRGGGAVADLNAFDDYWMACHVAQFPLPVLTGIGHEKDDSVVDLVAHTRLKTPTAVADFLVNKLNEFENSVLEYQDQATALAREKISEQQEKLLEYSGIFEPLVKEYLHRENLKLQRRVNNLQVAGSRTLNRKKNQLIRMVAKSGTYTRIILHEGNHFLTRSVRDAAQFARQLLRRKQGDLEMAEGVATHSDPQRLLLKGYSVTMKNGKVLKSVHGAIPGDNLQTLLSDGMLQSKVRSAEEPAD